MGYYAGYVALDQELASVRNLASGSAHNGYLETLVYFGYTGLTICILMLVWMFERGITLALASPAKLARLSIFPVCVTFLVASDSFVESTLVWPNNLNSMLVAIAAGMLARLPEQASDGDRAAGQNKPVF